MWLFFGRRPNEIEYKRKLGSDPEIVLERLFRKTGNLEVPSGRPPLQKNQRLLRATFVVSLMPNNQARMGTNRVVVCPSTAANC